MHGAYYLKDRDARPKVWYHEVDEAVPPPEQLPDLKPDAGLPRGWERDFDVQVLRVVRHFLGFRLRCRL